MKWKGFEALPAYLGGKRRLVPVIFARLAEVVTRERWRRLTFVDPFLGGGSVSLYAKAQGFRVLASDIAERSVTVGRALLENSEVRLRLGDVCLLGADPEAGYPRTAQRELVPHVLDEGQAAFIDRALHNTAQLADPKRSLLKLVLIKSLLGLHPISSLSASDAEAANRRSYDEVGPGRLAHYVRQAGAPSVPRLWRLARQVNRGVFPGRGKVVKKDVFEFLPVVSGDILYLDPPYPGTTSYEGTYEVVDLLLEGQRHQVSAFSSRTPPLAGLLSGGEHIPVWVLSMGNSVMSLDDVKAMLARHRKNVSCLAIPYRHLAGLAGSEKNEVNREFIFIAWDDVP